MWNIARVMTARDICSMCRVLFVQTLCYGAFSRRFSGTVFNDGMLCYNSIERCLLLLLCVPITYHRKMQKMLFSIKQTYKAKFWNTLNLYLKLKNIIYYVNIFFAEVDRYTILTFDIISTFNKLLYLLNGSYRELFWVFHNLKLIVSYKDNLFVLM